MSDISIVIVNYNTKESVSKCLASLFADVKKSGLNIKVTVVDNGSSDGIGKLIKSQFPTVACINLRANIGFGAAQNIGIKSAEARYYFILNPDTEFLPNSRAVERLYDYMEHNPKIGMVGPKLIYPDGSLQYSCYRFPTFWQPLYSRTRLGEKGRGQAHNGRAMMKDFSHEETRPVDWLMGSAMFVRGAALSQVGGFDERFFMYYEDSDLCRRFWEAHWPVYYAHDITIVHAHGRGSARVPGVIGAVLKNKLTRVHLASWLKYMWKWRGNYKYYAKLS